LQILPIPKQKKEKEKRKKGGKSLNCSIERMEKNPLDEAIPCAILESSKNLQKRATIASAWRFSSARRGSGYVIKVVPQRSATRGLEETSESPSTRFAPTVLMR